MGIVDGIPALPLYTLPSAHGALHTYALAGLRFYATNFRKALKEISESLS